MFLALVIIGFLVLYLIRIDYRKLYLAFQIPGPLPLPFIGNGWYFINKTSAENLQIATRICKSYGDGKVLGVWMKRDFHVFLSDPEAIEPLLSSKTYIEKSILYKFIVPWLNQGLLLSKGTKWVQRRKLLTPAFHFKILEQFVEIFDSQSHILIKNLEKYSGNGKVELFPFVTNCALDVICETAMGTQINAQSKTNSKYVLAVKMMSHIIHFRMSKFYLHEDYLFRFSSLCGEQKKALKYLHDFTDNVIQERRKKIFTESNCNKGDFDESIGQKRKMNFLDILLQSKIDGEPLSDLDIREEVDTFMFEGHDTTASGILFCLYNIAKYPDVQRKCFEEIRDVIGDDRQTPVTLNTLNNLNYLDLVIKETLRIFPSVPFIGRKVREETRLGKYLVPEGTDVIIPIYLMGQDPKLFPDPNKFWPERFLGETSASEKNPFTYIPFSAGPRNCIGQKFAVLEIKSVVSKVLRFFEISLDEDSLMPPTLTAELILASENKINFHIKPRQYQKNKNF